MNRRTQSAAFAFFLIFFLPGLVSAEPSSTLNIYLDADRTGTKASGDSIEMGIRLALSEVDYQVNGHKIELIIRNHHGNSRRSRINLEDFTEDDQGLVVFSGLHSPPILANLDFINQEKIPLLDPWAAAGDITRTSDEDGNNWIFRLSVDDTIAGELITERAVIAEGFQKVVLLLEDTGWGRSNEATMTSALASRGLIPLKTIWFNWNIGEIGAKRILNDIYTDGADVIFLVANAPEGKTFIRMMADRASEERLPIRSHWGITGGDIFSELGAEILVDEVDLQFIQTSFSFLNPGQSDFTKEVFKRLSDTYPEISTPEQLIAPTGFIHAYDLSRILLSAMNQIELIDDMIINRRNLRAALENLENPVQGLLKLYTKPFAPYSEEKKNAHEALGLADLRMAEFTPSGGICLLENK